MTLTSLRIAFAALSLLVVAVLVVPVHREANTHCYCYLSVAVDSRTDLGIGPYSGHLFVERRNGAAMEEFDLGPALIGDGHTVVLEGSRAWVLNGSGEEISAVTFGGPQVEGRVWVPVSSTTFERVERWHDVCQLLCPPWDRLQDPVLLVLIVMVALYQSARVFLTRRKENR